MTEKLLQVLNLQSHFFNERGVIRAVNGVSFEIDKGERYGLVGESGSGKSVTALSIIRLLKPPGRIVNGKVVFNGNDLMTISDAEISKIRGNQISTIFQNPRACLNPVIAVGEQVSRIYRIHQQLSKNESKLATKDIFSKVELPTKDAILKSYPHELSGGMCQRVLIAIMLACRPALLIADEPTTGLDATVQAQIVDLIVKLQYETELALILISHDIGLVAQTCQRIGVMRNGKIVEEGLA